MDKQIAMGIINGLCEVAELESKKSYKTLANELYQTRGKEFCIKLIMHLTMCISDGPNSTIHKGEKL